MTPLVATILAFIVEKRMYFIVGGMIVLAFLVVFFSRSCGKPTPKLDEAAIQKAQQAIAVEDRKAMVEILAKSDADEKVADDVVINAKSNTVNAIHESKAKWSNASDAEIREELLRRMNGTN